MQIIKTLLRCVCKQKMKPKPWTGKHTVSKLYLQLLGSPDLHVLSSRLAAWLPQISYKAHTKRAHKKRRL